MTSSASGISDSRTCCVAHTTLGDRPVPRRQAMLKHTFELYFSERLARTTPVLADFPCRFIALPPGQVNRSRTPSSRGNFYGSKFSLKVCAQRIKMQSLPATEKTSLDPPHLLTGFPISAYFSLCNMVGITYDIPDRGLLAFISVIPLFLQVLLTLLTMHFPSF
jgi:hypothetical protein